MQETSTSPAAILQFRQDIEAQFRRHIREAIEVSLTEELAAAIAQFLPRHPSSEVAIVGPVLLTKSEGGR